MSRRKPPKQHVSLTEVASLHRRASRMKKQDEALESLELLDESLESCPAYVPALLLAALSAPRQEDTRPLKRRRSFE